MIQNDSSFLFKCFGIMPISDIGIHHSCHSVYLLLRPLLHQLTVPIGVLNRDAVAHGKSHQVFIKDEHTLFGEFL